MVMTVVLVLAGTITALLAVSVLVRRSEVRTTRRLLDVLDRYSDR
jgi:hypothetical protein